MQVVVCCLAKNEEQYINDFVKWYLGIGVDRIYIYDNNDKKKGNALINAIDSEYLCKCEFIDIQGMSGVGFQHDIYTEFYNTHKNTFDWCFFIDVDEYLTNVSNIKMLLSLPIYRKYNQIRVKWRLFGDDDMVGRDMSLPLYKAFNKPVTSSLSKTLDKKGNLEKQGKCIVRGGLPSLTFTSVHYARYSGGRIVESCLPSGEPCYSTTVIKERYNACSIFLNHYMTKTISEFIEQKLNRNDAVFNTSIKLDYFWQINKKTKEKMRYIEQKLGTLE